MVTTNKKFLIFLALIVILVFFLFFYSKKDNLPLEKVENIKIGEQILKIEVADTIAKQEKGLSEREEIKNDEGMLFIFPKAKKYSFWMKDMNFPIDIIWLDVNKKIIFIKKNVLPETYPETFSPQNDSKYVLEVIGGFSEKNNLKEGETVQFLP